MAEQLRKEGKLPALGRLSKPLSCPGTPVETTIEPHLEMANGLTVPQLAFGLYKVPADEEGENIISDAIAAGYRHFDTASHYGNEATLGRAIKKSGIPRQDFFLASKVWNDAQKEGRVGVRQSVEKSLAEMDCGGYFDLFYIHWPVPGHFVDTYKELQDLYKMGKILSIGLSNFGPEEYEVILQDKGITIPPAVNQIEISPFMYRRAIIEYFQERNILMAASKALHRAGQLNSGIVKEIADSRSVAPAQVMLRWGLQKRLIVAAKTSNALRMQENRDVLLFSLSDNEMGLLDSLTTQEDISKREELEDGRRKGM
jgi:diketogulonate reductase-like aldo/keto reductase